MGDLLKGIATAAAAAVLAFSMTACSHETQTNTGTQESVIEISSEETLSEAETSAQESIPETETSAEETV